MLPFRWALPLGMMAIASAYGADAPPATKPSEELSATRVTLQVKDRTPQEAFAEFARAAHIEIVPPDGKFWGQVNSASASSITLDLQNQTYWHAMAELSAATGLCPIRAENGKVMLARDANGWSSRPAMDSGPFRIDASSLNVTQFVTLGREPHASSREYLVFAVNAEPYVVPSYCTISFDAAHDQTGNPIGHSQTDAPFTAFNGNQASLFLGIDPPPSATKIARIQLMLTIISIAGSKMLEAESVLDAPAGQEISGIEFSFAAKTTAGGYQVGITLHNASADAELWKRIRPALQSAPPRLVDEKDVAYEIRGSGTGATDAAKLTFTYEFVSSAGPARRQVGRPSKLIWQIPTKLVETRIPVTFENLPLH